jgi:hypothetical protein
MKRKILIIICVIIIIYFYCYSIESFKNFVNEAPKVEFPFKNLYDDKGNRLNIILLAAPFREEKHEKLYLKYKEKGYMFCGISSYLNFPNKILNPYEDKFHEKQSHDYLSMVSAWLHCFRDIDKNDIEAPADSIGQLDNIRRSGLPNMLLTEADLKDVDNSNFKYDTSIKKEYDFMYVCLSDNEKCEPGWQSYNRNWDLAKKCLEVMCGQFKLKGVLVGRQNCEFTERCNGIVKVHPFLDYNAFQKEMQKCKFLFVPNISDASPRVITEAITYDMPVLVNKYILGGWHNVIPGVTGEFFSNEHNIVDSLKKITTSQYTPKKWFVENRGMKKSGKQLAEFLIKNYPNISNKKMKYATITI